MQRWLLLWKQGAMTMARRWRGQKPHLGRQAAVCGLCHCFECATCFPYLFNCFTARKLASA